MPMPKNVLPLPRVLCSIGSSGQRVDVVSPREETQKQSDTHSANEGGGNGHIHGWIGGRRWCVKRVP
jgi:hypothetical protein